MSDVDCTKLTAGNVTEASKLDTEVDVSDWVDE